MPLLTSLNKSRISFQLPPSMSSRPFANQALDVVFQLVHCLIEGLETAIGAGKHYRAFHRREHVRRKRRRFDVGRKTIGGIFDKLPYRITPRLEVLND